MDGGLGTFDRYSSAIKRLSELKTRKQAQEDRANQLSQISTYLSLTVQDPANDGTFLLVRREAGLAAQLVLQTVKKKQYRVYLHTTILTL